MSTADVNSGAATGRPPPYTPPEPEPVDERHPTMWTGWISFAATMLVVIGFSQGIQGFTALFKDDYYVVPKSGLLVTVDYTTWGWVHIALGAVAIVVAFGMLAGSLWARVVAVILAVVSTVVNIGFLKAYPWWSTAIIIFNVLLIWAVTVHGREMKALTEPRWPS